MQLKGKRVGEWESQAARGPECLGSQMGRPNRMPSGCTEWSEAHHWHTWDTVQNPDAKVAPQTRCTPQSGNILLIYNNNGDRYKHDDAEVPKSYYTEREDKEMLLHIWKRSRMSSREERSVWL